MTATDPTISMRRVRVACWERHDGCLTEQRGPPEEHDGVELIEGLFHCWVGTSEAGEAVIELDSGLIVKRSIYHHDIRFI